MKIDIKATNIELTPAISDQVHQKIGDVERFIAAKDPESVRAYVEVEKTTQHHQSGPIFRAEVNLHIDGKYFRASESEEDLYVAIDSVREEIARVIKEDQDKRRDIKRRSQGLLKRILRGFGK